MFALLTQQLDKNTTVPSHCFSLSRVWVFLELGLILSPGLSSVLGVESLSVHMLQTLSTGRDHLPAPGSQSQHMCVTHLQTRPAEPTKPQVCIRAPGDSTKEKALAERRATSESSS